jgi:competence protein ComEC
VRSPIAGVAIVFCLGICVAGRLKIPFWAAFGAASLLLGLTLRTQRRAALSTAAIFFLLLFSGMAALKNSQELPPYHISKYFFPAFQKTCVLKGAVSDEPRRRGAIYFCRFKTLEIQFDGVNRNCCGEIQAQLTIGRPLRYGEILLIRGRISRFRKLLVIRGKSPADVIFLGEDGSTIRKFALKIKQATEKILALYTCPGACAVLDAMILGEKENVPQWIMDAMVKSGTVHILVVSGYNVGIVALVILLALRLARIPRRIRLLLAMPLLMLYCLITGASSPVVRATIMALVFISAQLLRREPDIYASLSLAALVILATDPQQLFDISFQLSFASVWAIIWIYPNLKKVLSVDSLKLKFLRYILEGCLVSASAWAGTAGLIACYFKVFSPVTVFANLVIVPLASLITLCGFSLIAAGAFFPAGAPFIGRSSEFLVSMLIALNNIFISLPGAFIRF